MVVCLEMIHVAVTAVGVVCMEGPAVQVCIRISIFEYNVVQRPSLNISMYVPKWRELQWINVHLSTWIHWNIV